MNEVKKEMAKLQLIEKLLKKTKHKPTWYYGAAIIYGQYASTDKEYQNIVNQRMPLTNYANEFFLHTLRYSGKIYNRYLALKGLRLFDLLDLSFKAKLNLILKGVTK